MAEASLRSDVSNRTQKLSGEVNRALRGVLSFVVVMIALVVLWQGIKAIFNLDGLVLPNVEDILGALFQPIQEGKPLLGQILLGAALFTLRGAVLGFAFAVIFAHSRLLERGLMPFVVASQTVPILAIAPMVVVWLKAGWL